MCILCVGMLKSLSMLLTATVKSVSGAERHCGLLGGVATGIVPT